MMTTAHYRLQESREFWTERTECCGSDSTFIGDAGSGGPVCRGCWAEITEWVPLFEKDETTEEAK